MTPTQTQHSAPASSATDAELAAAIAAERSVVAGGNLGASLSQALTTRDTILTGTLTANHALTLTGLVSGYWVRLLLTQNATGGWTLTVNGAAVTVNAAASAVTFVEISYDGTDLYVKGA